MISGLFKGAAREAQRVLEDAGTKPDDKLRAAYILLQSFFELNRLPHPNLGPHPPSALCHHGIPVANSAATAGWHHAAFILYRS